MNRAPPRKALREALADAQADGRALLTEPEALAVAAALGLSVPRHQVVRGADELDLDALPERLVVKAVVPGLVHKTEAGAVAAVSRDRVAEAMAGMAALGPEAFLVMEEIPHEREPGGELLLSLRWSREHGPVVTLALGGVAAEALGVPPALATPDLPLKLPPVLEALATGRLRGRAGRCAPGALRALVDGLLEAAPLLPDVLLELELNPVVRAGGAWVALDAVARRGAVGRAPERPPVDLGPILRPRSLAVVGASARGINPGRAILRAALGAGFPPESVRVVKAGLERLDGVTCVPSLEALEPVDLLVLAVPAGAVEGAWAAALRRARAVLLIPGGTGEGPGSEGLARRLADGLRRARGEGLQVRVIGGNSLGIQSRPGRLDTLFVPAERVGASERAGPLAVISSSGALALALKSALPVDPAVVLTLGNQLDLSVADAAEGLAREPGIEALILYIEGLPDGDGARLVRATRALSAAGRRVVVYRAGRTPAGQRATATHTAALAGDAATSQALLARAGAMVARSRDMLADLAVLALSGPRPAGRRVAVMSNAGFECVAAADHLGALALAELAPETLAGLRALLEGAGLAGLVSVKNPLDLTPIADDAVFVEAARLLLADPGVDLGLVGCVPFSAALSTLEGEGGALIEGLAGLTGGAPWAAVVEGGRAYDALRERLAERGVAVLGRMDRAMAAADVWARHSP